MQMMALEYYFDPTSPTFGKPSECGVRAGYTPKTARIISTFQWWKDALAAANRVLLQKAERNLDEMLDLECNVSLIDNKSGLEIKKINSNLMRIKADITKFVAERMGKEKYAEKHVLIKVDI